MSPYDCHGSYAVSTTVVVWTKEKARKGPIKILASLLNGAVLIEQTGWDFPISMATTAGLTLRSA